MKVITLAIIAALCALLLHGCYQLTPTSIPGVVWRLNTITGTAVLCIQGHGCQ